MARSSREHAEVVLAAIIPNRRDLLDKAMRKVTPEHFTDPTLRAIYNFLVKYVEVASWVLPKEALSDMLVNADAGKKLLLEEMYDALAEKPATESDFDWSLDLLRDLHAEKQVGEALNEAMQILVQGVENKTGEVAKGQAEARNHILERFSIIERGLFVEEAPEGDMRLEHDEMIADYQNRKKLREAGLSDGILYGIPELDIKTGGYQNGELNFVIGYTSCGKTSLATVQLAWHAAVMQGKNVVIATTETLRPQVQRKIIARHSRMSQFDLGSGLNSKDIKNGSLLPQQEKKLYEVIDDFTRSKDYGICNIIQVPKGTTVVALENRLNRLQKEFNIDLVIMDYIALLATGRKRQTAREELAGIVLESKQLATSFDSGRGIPLVSPWQVSRSAWEMAQKMRGYNLTALAETAETERSADGVLALLEPNPNTSRYADIMAQVLKNRDGETSDGITLRADYATSYFEAETSSSDLDDLLE